LSSCSPAAVFLSPENLTTDAGKRFLARKTRQNTRKNKLRSPFVALLRNSLPTRALIREILYSHSLLKRAILINLSQKIAKFQTNAGGSNGRFAANIRGG
jgi:hypothetical protein